MIVKGSIVRVKEVTHGALFPGLEQYVGVCGEVVVLYILCADVKFAGGVRENFMLSELEVVDPCEEVTSGKQDSDHNPCSS